MGKITAWLKAHPFLVATTLVFVAVVVASLVTGNDAISRVGGQFIGLALIVRFVYWLFHRRNTHKHEVNNGR